MCSMLCTHLIIDGMPAWHSKSASFNTFGSPPWALCLSFLVGVNIQPLFWCACLPRYAACLHRFHEPDQVAFLARCVRRFDKVTDEVLPEAASLCNLIIQVRCSMQQTVYTTVQMSHSASTV